MMQRRQTSTRGRISLGRLLSKFGVASRTRAADVIAAGRVAVNGAVVRRPERWVDPRADRVTVDGREIRARPFVYYAMHKPAGVVTTRSDERGRRTVYDLLPREAGWVFPVGRLDRETSGLLLFTNDTKLGNQLTDPGFHVPRTYIVTTDRPLDPLHRRMMEGGMRLDPDKQPLRPATVSGGPRATEAEITIHEGRNRQVRRMFEQCGYTVTALHRTRIGPLSLGPLDPGSVRRLLPGEVGELSKAVAETSHGE